MFPPTLILNQGDVIENLPRERLFIKLDSSRKALEIDSLFSLDRSSPNHGLSEMVVILNGLKILSLFKLMVMISRPSLSPLTRLFNKVKKLRSLFQWRHLKLQETTYLSLDSFMATIIALDRRFGVTSL